MNNLFFDPGPATDGEERFEPLLHGPGGLLVERILSHGQMTPEATWLEQGRDEWVAVLEGEAVLGFENGSRAHLRRGDHCWLRRGLRHRVEYTSSPCIWIAVHGTLKPE